MRPIELRIDGDGNQLLPGLSRERWSGFSNKPASARDAHPSAALADEHTAVWRERDVGWFVQVIYRHSQPQP
jgi:hypothetical protein